MSDLPDKCEQVVYATPIHFNRAMYRYRFVTREELSVLNILDFRPDLAVQHEVELRIRLREKEQRRHALLEEVHQYAEKLRQAGGDWSRLRKDIEKDVARVHEDIARLEEQLPTPEKRFLISEIIK